MMKYIEKLKEEIPKKGWECWMGQDTCLQGKCGMSPAEEVAVLCQVWITSKARMLYMCRSQCIECLLSALPAMRRQEMHAWVRRLSPGAFSEIDPLPLVVDRHPLGFNGVKRDTGSSLGVEAQQA